MSPAITENRKPSANALAPFRIAQTPLHWEDYCRLLGWLPPPHGVPAEEPGDERFRLLTYMRL